MLTGINNPEAVGSNSTGGSLLFITSFFGGLPRYHWRIASIVLQIVVVLVKLSEGPVNWPHVVTLASCNGFGAEKFSVGYH